jgi:hypothetical protein
LAAAAIAGIAGSRPIRLLLPIPLRRAAPGTKLRPPRIESGAGMPCAGAATARRGS